MRPPLVRKQPWQRRRASLLSAHSGDATCRSPPLWTLALRPASLGRRSLATRASLMTGTAISSERLARPPPSPLSASLRPRPRPSYTRCQTRGKKTRTVVRLEDLPQGIVLPTATSQGKEGHQSRTGPSFDASEEPEASSDSPSDAAPSPAYPTVVLQARSNMHKFSNCVLLTRVGGFYELYFEHAQEYGPLLNIKVASKKTNAGPVPMAGFPFFQLDRFLKVLVHDLNRYVAIAEEFPNSAADKVKSGGLMHDRRVARIVTPGTLIDENFIDPYTNNYVMAIHVDVDTDHDDDATLSPPNPAVPIGLAWLDLSTGHFYTQSTTLPALGSVLSRVAPREIVLDERMQLLRSNGSGSVHPLFSILDEDRQQQQLVTYSATGADRSLASSGLSSLSSLSSLSDWAPFLESEIPAQAAKEFSAPEIAAGSLLLHYVKDRLQGLSMKLQPPVRYDGMQAMTIDKNSMRSLEIKQTLRDGVFRGSLLHAVRRTVTKSGARLLNEWLSAPSNSLDVIVARQDLVARFIQEEDICEGVTQLLKRSYDSHRLVQKFALGRGDPDDLLDLAKTITATKDIVSLLRYVQPTHEDGEQDVGGGNCLDTIADRIQLERPLAIAKQIRDSVDEEGLLQQHEMEEDEADAMMSLAKEVVQAEGSLEQDASVLRKRKEKTTAAAAATPRKRPSLRDYYGEDNEAWVMKPSASKGLEVLHAQLADLTRDREALTDELRERFQAPSIILKWTPGLGHICHVRGKDAKRRLKGDKGDKAQDGTARQAETEAGDAGPTATTISSSRTTRSLHVPEWTALGQKIDQARFQIRAEEQRVFHTLREAVVRSLVPLRRNAAVLDELDIVTSFARLALEQNLCRPRLNRGTATAIVGGRHPTVEGGLTEQGRSFTRNDLFLGGKEERGPLVWLVTGPNMAGKSTFLRQNALITILAQVGCYVPADYADLGLVDALFSRVGSADNLFRDQSTFMVEMLETAHILRQATARSFVIMDEIGRGTTPEDGTAVAFAALHHLVHVNRCRGLFATHFHALADLAAEAGMAGLDGKDPGAGGSSHPVELYCTDVEEDGAGGFVYVHRLRPGINRQSHALKVARLAGLPEEAIRVAQQVLAKSGVH